MADPAPLRADLVLEGGGVKGIGLTGAAATLARAGYSFPRVAGTSAGAVVGAFLVALQRAGEPIERLEDVARTLDYQRLRDRGAVGRAAGPLARVVDGFSLAFDGGVFEGDYLRSWVKGALGDLGVHTFGDLRDRRPGQQPAREPALLAAGHRERRVPQAVRPAALGLPALRPRPRRAGGRRRGARLGVHPVLLRAGHPAVDGRPRRASPTSRPWSTAACCPTSRSRCSTAPTAQPPRWPTFGVRLSMRPDGRVSTTEVRGTVSLALSLVETMLEACDGQHIDDPCVQARSIFVDTSGISPVDFGITDEQQEQLLLAGHQAAGAFLADWDWTGYLAAVPGRSRRSADEVWLPYADWPAAAATCPTACEVDVYDGSGDAAGRASARSSSSCCRTSPAPAPARLMADMPSLRVAQTLTAGVDDVRPLVPEGVTLCNARGVHDASTAELAVALALAALRGIPDHVRAAERGEWAHDTRPSLADRRVLLVGLRRGRRRRSSGGWPASSARYAGWRAGPGPVTCRSSRSRRWPGCCRGPRS